MHLVIIYFIIFNNINTFLLFHILQNVLKARGFIGENIFFDPVIYILHN